MRSVEHCLRVTAAACLAVLVAAAGCRGKSAAAAGMFPIVLQTDWYPQPEMGGFYVQTFSDLEGHTIAARPGSIWF